MCKVVFVRGDEGNGLWSVWGGVDTEGGDEQFVGYALRVT
jgi:hypothetical protein